MTKTIIYLDQSYLSNLTKARLGPKEYPRTPPCFRALLRALRSAVDEDVAVCPISPYHFTESELAPRHLENEIYNTLELLCCGVSYLAFPDILENQVVRAYRKFLGADSEADSWESAFDRNPDESGDHKHHIERSRGDFSAWTKEVRQYHQRTGLLPALGDYEFSRKYEIAQLISTLYIQPLLAYQRGQATIFTLSGPEYVMHRMQDFRELRGSEPTESDLDAILTTFLASWLVEPPPYADVYASIVASVVTRHQLRTVQGGDLEDASAAALAVPYCDIFTADRFMKDILTASELDRKYGCVVYSPGIADVKALTDEIRRASRKGKKAKGRPGSPEGRSEAKPLWLK
jgi:hypothetical protein